MKNEAKPDQLVKLRFGSAGETRFAVQLSPVGLC